MTDSLGRLIEAPFLGGFNAPRPQLADIDGDGDDDLFLQEVTGKLFFFERDGDTPEGLPQFRYRSPRYQEIDAGEWYRFADLDGDGDLDLLTERRLSYIRYYRNDGTPREARFTAMPDSLRDDLGRPIFSDRQNIPQIADVDCNGRPDLLVGKVDGSASRYEMVARPQGNANPSFRLVTDRFEDISIIAQFGSLHGANTMALADADGDGDLDLFWGDYFEEGLLLIPNTGTCQAFNYRSGHTRFPEARPLLTSGYNAPAFGMLDRDGRLDMVVGVLGGAFNPNRSTIENLYAYTRGPHGEWIERSRQLIPTIDVGSESLPVLLDWDGDGDLDLLLANKLDPNDLGSSHVYRFENTGDRKRPAFALRGALPAPLTGAYHLAPASGDLDGDGLPDLVVGSWGPRVAWYRNRGTRTAPDYTLMDSALVTITRGSNTTPTLGDLDGDGDLDLLIGEASGTLNYYRNDGTRQVPRFVLVSDTWNEIDVGRRSAPHLVDLDGDGDLDLLVGSELGGIHFYRNDGTRAAFRFTDAGFLGSDLPAMTAPAAGDLDGDGRPEIVVGSVGGGVTYLARPRR